MENNTTTCLNSENLLPDPVGQLYIKKLSSTSIIPSKGTTGSAGFDLYSDENCHIPSNTHHPISTGIALAIPSGYYGRIASRSGMALRSIVQILGGVVDNDYRGEVKVIMLNSGTSTLDIKRGDRIAQLIIERYVNPIITVVTEFTDNTQRAEKGFGSTGT